MKEESITKATNMILEGLEKLEIDHQDKLELMLNLYTFLTNYEQAIKSDVKVKGKER